MLEQNIEKTFITVPPMISVYRQIVFALEGGSATLECQVIITFAFCTSVVKVEEEGNANYTYRTRAEQYSFAWPGHIPFTHKPN